MKIDLRWVVRHRNFIVVTYPSEQRGHVLGARMRRHTATADSQHGLPVADLWRARDFAPSDPNQIWSANITDLWMDEG